jgi:hypothetical protein
MYQEVYKGFIITPHSLKVDETAWSIGVFVRDENKDATYSKYIPETGVRAKSEIEALALGIDLAKRLIDQKLLNSLRSTDEY